MTAICGASVAHAEDAKESTSEGLNGLLKMMGLTQERTLTGGSCKIGIKIDQSEVIAGVPALQKIEILNNEMSKSELTKKPTRTTMAVALQMAPLIIKDVYDNNSSVDKCLFVYNLVSDDDYGNERKDLMFSYDFEKSIYKRVNWDKFQTQNLIKVAKNFKFGPVVAARASSEDE